MHSSWKSRQSRVDMSFWMDPTMLNPRLRGRENLEPDGQSTHVWKADLGGGEAWGGRESWKEKRNTFDSPLVAEDRGRDDPSCHT